MSLLFIDMECGAPDWTAEERAAYARRKVPGNYSKPETIERWLAEHGDDAWYDAAKDPDLARIIVIGAAIDDGPVELFGPHPEVRQTLAVFGDWLAGHPNTRWVHYNGRGYDLPILKRRAALYGLDALARRVPWRRYSPLSIDLSDAWSLGRHDYPKADAVCDALGIARDPDEITGADVPRLWSAGDTAPIFRHVRGDVGRLRQMYHRMEAAGFLEAA